MGDIELLSDVKGGFDFFSGLKQNLDEILADLFPVHYYFFAEAPSSATTNGDAYGTPPPRFEYLNAIFRNEAEGEGEEDGGNLGNIGRRYPQRVSFVNDADVRTTIYHEMNADMVITTGSSFPLVGVTVSPKVRVVFFIHLGGGVQ